MIPVQPHQLRTYEQHSSTDRELVQPGEALSDSKSSLHHQLDAQDLLKSDGSGHLPKSSDAWMFLASVILGPLPGLALPWKTMLLDILRLCDIVSHDFVGMSFFQSLHSFDHGVSTEDDNLHLVFHNLLKFSYSSNIRVGSS